MGSTKFVRFRLLRSAFRTTLLCPKLLRTSGCLLGLDCRLASAARSSQAVVACKPQTMTKLKKRYLWSWAIAGVTFPLLILLVGLFMPKPPEWNPFQEAKISPAQPRIAVVAALLWPTDYVAEFLALAVTDSGVDSGAALPSLLNAAIYLGIGLILWSFAELFSIFFPRRS
jgi:hypothetical protein